MSIIRRLGQTPPGKWLWRRRSHPLLGRPVQAVIARVRATGDAAERMKPANRAHDEAQRAILAAFEARLERRPHTGSVTPETAPDAEPRP